ncbi:MAG: DUF222 domain-containing protein [Acidimicrobiia bacterium]|nr:DUF222 domain-containing protein [Acidimicrobiia bacterium]
MHEGIRTTATAALHDALAEVLDTDPATLSDGELLDGLADLYQAEARARFTAAIDARDAHANVGAQSLPMYIVHACRVPTGVARHHVRTARALRHLPHTAQRLADGDITAWHASRISEHHSNPRARTALERDDELLADRAAALHWSIFEKVLAYWVQRADTDGTDDDAQARKDRRRVSISRTFEGIWVMDALLDPVAGATVEQALRRIEQELLDTERGAVAVRLGRDPLTHELDRTPPQRRADALEELARRAMATPAGGRQPSPAGVDPRRLRDLRRPHLRARRRHRRRTRRRRRRPRPRRHRAGGVRERRPRDRDQPPAALHRCPAPGDRAARPHLHPRVLLGRSRPVRRRPPRAGPRGRPHHPGQRPPPLPVPQPPPPEASRPRRRPLKSAPAEPRRTAGPPPGQIELGLRPTERHPGQSRLARHGGDHGRIR